MYWWSLSLLQRHFRFWLGHSRMATNSTGTQTLLFSYSYSSNTHTSLSSIHLIFNSLFSIFCIFHFYWKLNDQNWSWIIASLHEASSTKSTYMCCMGEVYDCLWRIQRVILSTALVFCFLFISYSCLIQIVCFVVLNISKFEKWINEFLVLNGKNECIFWFVRFGSHKLWMEKNFCGRSGNHFNITSI
jgi:hypothetical protein